MVNLLLENCVDLFVGLCVSNWVRDTACVAVCVLQSAKLLKIVKLSSGQTSICSRGLMNSYSF